MKTKFPSAVLFIFILVLFSCGSPKSETDSSPAINNQNPDSSPTVNNLIPDFTPTVNDQNPDITPITEISISLPQGKIPLNELCSTSTTKKPQTLIFNWRFPNQLLMCLYALKKVISPRQMTYC